METTKPIHTVVLDTGCIIRNDPSVSTLLAQSESLVTVPAIISEIKDAATRSRLDSTLLPFLTLRTPTPASVKFVTDFARRTGDLVVLSKPDVQIIALAYEIECRRNGGDWRLRKAPGQKRVNGAPPSKAPNAGTSDTGKDCESIIEAPANDDQISGNANPDVTAEPESAVSTDAPLAKSPPEQDEQSLDPEPKPAAEQVAAHTEDSSNVPAAPVAKPQEKLLESSEDVTTADMATLTVNDDAEPANEQVEPKIDSVQNSASSQEDPDSDSDGWITPSNLKKKQAHDAGASTTQTPEPATMQVGVLTTDFAMQNVILQINLNLLSSSMTRIKNLKTFVLRCHACFQVTKDMTKQFCPRCGQPALTRVSCSTSANGEFKLHLKKNMQWNTRGDRYSIPKPVHGSANGRMQGGGKGGWGNELILSEDRKEYERASKVEKKMKERSLMDEDYLPSILTGDRGRAGGRVKVGAGRTVNSRKR